LDPIESFPLLWQTILNALPVRPPLDTTARGEGLLGELQHLLLAMGAGKKSEKISWKDDGTLRIVRSETSLMGSRWIADTLKQSQQSLLYVATSQAAQTEAFLGASDVARLGLSEASGFRPALQVLPIVLELMWKPLNFHALIQFLTHPICPLRLKVRRQLASVQAEYPGIGGPRWRKVLVDIAEDAGDEAPEILKAISFWVEHERFDPIVGAPIDVVLERAEALARYFLRIPPQANPALLQAYVAGHSQCKAFAKNLAQLKTQGQTTLQRRQAEQLASQATARGSVNPLRIAEVGAVARITDPAAVVEPQDVVVWGPLNAPVLPSVWPWSRKEISTLKKMGCDLPTTESRLQRLAEQWLRPVLAAKKQLILLLPPEGSEVHPVWQVVKEAIANLPVVSTEDMLTNDSRTKIHHSPLPSIRRWWSLPDDILLREMPDYSYSQLERQLFNPYHWLLSYPAKLRSSALRSLADDFRLNGLLAHSLIERFYEGAQGLSMSDQAFTEWFNPAFDQLINEEGAVYLMPGRRLDLENLRDKLKRAMNEVRSLIVRFGVVKVMPELSLSGHFKGGVLTGFADLVLAKKDGSQAIVDIKSRGKNHRKRLEENNHLQLALYAELIRQTTQKWPAVAYFLVDNAKLLARDDHWFNDIQVVQSKTEASTPDVWRNFLVSWKWRQDQFDKKFFEVVLNDEDADEHSAVPEDGLKHELLDKRYNECLHLAGWEADA